MKKMRKWQTRQNCHPNVNSLDIAMKTRAESLIEKLVIFSAIIVHQTVPYQCIDRVVGDNGDRIIFQRILTPRPGPRVTLRDTLRPQHQQHKEQQPQPQHSESGAYSRKPVQSGDRNGSRNKGSTVASDSLGSRKPLQAEKEVIQSTEIDLRVGGISQEEIYNDKQHTDEVKNQVERLQDEPKSKNMHEDLQKGNILGNKPQDLKYGEHRISWSTTKNGDIAVPAVLFILYGRISIL